MPGGGHVYVVVTREAGRGWLPGEALGRQPLWREHAAFMDRLADAGRILVGGPLGSGPLTLLLFKHESEGAARSRLDADPWTVRDILPATAAYAWRALLGVQNPSALRRRKARYDALEEQGPAWQPGVGRREPRLWQEHAALMDLLTEEGVILTGGPLRGQDGPHRALLVLDAEGACAMRAAALRQIPGPRRAYCGRHAWTCGMALGAPSAPAPGQEA